MRAGRRSARRRANGDTGETACPTQTGSEACSASRGKASPVTVTALLGRGGFPWDAEKAAPVYFLPFLAGADFDFLAGDCEDVFVDFLVALFMRLILP